MNILANAKAAGEVFDILILIGAVLALILQICMIVAFFKLCRNSQDILEKLELTNQQI